MSTVRPAAQTESSDIAVQRSKRRRFNAYPLLGLAITILCAVLVYGGIYLFAS